MSTKLTMAMLNQAALYMMDGSDVRMSVVDGLGFRRHLSQDTFEFSVELKPVRYTWVMDESNLGYRSPQEVVDTVADAIKDCSSALRGLHVRSWLDAGRSIDWVDHKAESEHQECERVGTKLIEIGEALLRRSKQSR